MDETLSRGRQTDGEWVEGYYAKVKLEMNLNQETHIIFPLDFSISLHDKTSKYYEVIPETVGRFTGLTDKNGRKIFEGDIVKRNVRIWIVEYDNKYAQFRMTAHTEKGVSWSRNFELVPSDWCEVIGNIYDNPIYDIPELYESELTAMEKVKVQKVKSCADCVHEKACQMWNNRSISNKDASCCVNFEQRDVKSTKRAYWREEKLGLVSLYRCSKCGSKDGAYEHDDFKYCPDCGAKMDGENDEQF